MLCCTYPRFFGTKCCYDLLFLISTIRSWFSLIYTVDYVLSQLYFERTTDSWFHKVWIFYAPKSTVVNYLYCTIHMKVNLVGEDDFLKKIFMVFKLLAKSANSRRLWQSNGFKCKPESFLKIHQDLIWEHLGTEKLQSWAIYA